jgi:protein SCO1/2
MFRRIAIAAAVVVFAAGGAYAFRRGGPANDGFRTGVFEPARDAPDFELDGSRGTKVHLADYRGKIVLLEFGFTFCQQVCPVTLAHLVEVHKTLGPAASDVQVVFVTVDPKRDSPARLNEFLTAFNPAFLGATGSPAELEKMRDAYGVMAQEVRFPNEEPGYSHSSFIYMLDRRGKIRSLVPFGTKPEDIVHDIRLLLTER